MREDYSPITDMKQMLLIALMRWKIILFFTCMGLTVGIIQASFNRTLQSTANEAPEDMVYEKEYYARMKEIYGLWISEAQKQLMEGMPDKLPEGVTRLGETYNAIYILTMLPSLKIQMDSMRDPMSDDRPHRSKAVIIFGCTIIGTAIGLCAIISFYLLSGRIVSAYYTAGRYGVHILTVIRGDYKPGLLAKGDDEDYLKMTRDEQIKVAVENLTVFAPGMKKATVTGTVGSECIQKVKNILESKMEGMKVAEAPNINMNAMSYETVRNHDNVIVVEKVLQSRYKAVDREMQFLSEWNKNIVGFIFVY